MKRRRRDRSKAYAKNHFHLLVFTLIAILSIGICLTPAFTALAHASAGGEVEEGRNWADFAWRALNFLVLAGLLHWLFAAKVKAFFTGRQRDVKSVLADLAAAKDEAEKKFAEYNAKLDEAAEEIQAMAEMIRKQGLAEKARIVEAAQKMAEKMKEDFRKRMEQEIKIARHELRIEAVRLSLQSAHEMLKRNISATDHAAMVVDYIDKVVSRN